MHNVIFYSICILYVLSIALFVSDMTTPLLIHLGEPKRLQLCIAFIETISFGCSDFIAQFILIYRCWIVWGCNIRIVIIPSVLALAFLATWIAGGNSMYIFLNVLLNPEMRYSMTVSSLALSLTVNALVTSLIVFKIFKVFREVKAASDDQIFGTTGGSRLQGIIFILIESGMALFSIQVARLVVTGMDADAKALDVIVGIHEMLNGIIPTIILLRTSMGLSFDDEKSMEEFAIESLRFGFNHPNSVPETGSIGIVGQDSGDDDIGIQQSNENEVVERRIL